MDKTNTSFKISFIVPQQSRGKPDIQCSQRAFDLGAGGLGKNGSSKARHGPSTLPSPDRQLEAAFLGCILTLTSPI